MFQAVFRTQSEALLVWPIIGLVIFITVFTLKVVAIMRRSDASVKQTSELPLEADALGERP